MDRGEDVPAECAVDNGQGDLIAIFMVEDGDQAIDLPPTQWGEVMSSTSTYRYLEAFASCSWSDEGGVQGPSSGQNWWRSG